MNSYNPKNQPQARALVGFQPTPLMLKSVLADLHCTAQQSYQTHERLSILTKLVNNIVPNHVSNSINMKGKHTFPENTRIILSCTIPHSKHQTTDNFA